MTFYTLVPFIQDSSDILDSTTRIRHFLHVDLIVISQPWNSKSTTEVVQFRQRLFSLSHAKLSVKSVKFRGNPLVYETDDLIIIIYRARDAFR